MNASESPSNSSYKFIDGSGRSEPFNDVGDVGCPHISMPHPDVWDLNLKAIFVQISTLKILGRH